MAAGKSTVGFIVANTIGYGFVDLDERIVTRDGRSIPEIFAASGEPFFRELEAAVLSDTSALENTVIALGGGALATEEAWQSIADDSAVVYLDTDPGVLARRIFYGRTERPLMMDESGRRLRLDVLEARIRTMLEERSPHYTRAHITVRSGDRSIGKTVDAVVAALRRFSARTV